ncbi:hypothetical protein AXY43_02560 [Clostridium sp. MF28]|jgi:hypothetical protein|uniref:Uncharacterized protein n=1 Tax=Clostridium diolis TaxID=223919 RepID=A0AAV3VYE6_9CLOT|nr:hypothetical protein AXY43_02560 [Clostridium sp. MF28]NOV60496.1 hypothetical protein [Clostridium beijerinckii]GEA30548.1 hypothetical protein CDIOL_14710 [Clostridium diolis]NOV70726.1 hypothetical protein [Clostridium beijerinckii]NOW33644.1 hypothetical protein [Clostridium beijerinckii]
MLKKLVNNQAKKYDHAIIIRSMIMMKFTSMLTKELGISTNSLFCATMINIGIIIFDFTEE